MRTWLWALVLWWAPCVALAQMRGDRSILPEVAGEHAVAISTWRPIARRFIGACRARWETYEDREGIGREIVGWAPAACEDTLDTLSTSLSEASCHAVALELRRHERTHRSLTESGEVLREMCLGTSSPLADLTRARYLAAMSSEGAAAMLRAAVDAPPALARMRGRIVDASPTAAELRALVGELDDEDALVRWRAAAWDRAETSEDPYVRAAVWMRRAREASPSSAAVAAVRALLCDPRVPELLRQYIAEHAWHEGFDDFGALVDPCQGGEACDEAPRTDCET